MTQAEKSKNILVFNCGSSSLGYKVYQASPPSTLTVIARGKAHHVGVKSQEAPYLVHTIRETTSREPASLPDHAAAASKVLRALDEAQIEIDAVGHRFVHGGTRFTRTTRITSENLPDLEACSPLAPIHNPNSLSVILLCRERLGDTPQFAAFDTAFHAQIPEYAYRYALPLALSEQLGLRKYGFHGLSYQFVTGEAARFLDIPVGKLQMVACHLGTGGSSAAAIAGGHSIDTSMGYTPLPGLMMSTRSGDLDPSILLTMIERDGYTPEQLNRLLNKESGLLGISGISSDLFEIVAQAEAGAERARLAVEMVAHRLKAYIGSYLAVLGTCDALVFTDDIGQRCWQIREAVCSGLSRLGIELDLTANRKADGSRVQTISLTGSPVQVLVVPTDEEIVIAREVLTCYSVSEES